MFSNRLIALFVTALLVSLFSLNADILLSAELSIQVVDSPQSTPEVLTQPDQLPLSRVASGTLNIKKAWLAGPTDRYPHGVLGDKLEASRLEVETFDGKHINFDLPKTRVFEDLEPRLADLNDDNTDEIIVVESDIKLGASLSIYSIADNRLVPIASTPFLGTPNRWLNPLGVGDFDGDGNSDIALVTTPHIGGVLNLYGFSSSGLSLFAEYRGVSNHKIGSTELGLGTVVPAAPRDRILVPVQSRRALALLEWTPDGIREITRIELPGALESSLISSGHHRWRVEVKTGDSYEVQLSEGDGHP